MVDVRETVGMIQQYETYYQGNRFLGHSSVEFPELKHQTTELTGAGIMGKVDMPVQGLLESLELSITFRSVTEDVAILSEQHAIDLAFYGSQQVYNYASAKTIARRVKIDTRGFIKSSEIGKMEPGELTDTKITYECIVIKVSVDNKEIFYADKLAMVYRVEGTDYFADTRKALGLDTTIGDVISAVIN